MLAGRISTPTREEGVQERIKVVPKPVPEDVTPPCSNLARRVGIMTACGDPVVMSGG